MSKKTSAAEAMGRRTETFIESGDLLGETEDDGNTTDDKDANPRKVNDDKTIIESKIKRDQQDAGQGQSTEEENIRGRSTKRIRKRKAEIIEHPAVHKALTKSRVQRTVRLKPLLWIDYEQTCAERNMELDFNNHVAEAFGEWLDRLKKTSRK